MGRNAGQLYEINPDPLNPSNKQHAIRISLYRNVTNAKDLLALLHERKIDAALLRADLVLGIFQVLAACQRAIHCVAFNRMSTKGIHSEIVYSMSATRNITDSLKTFGIDADAKNILLITYDDTTGDKCASIGKQITGKCVNLSELSQVRDVSRIKQVYHVQEPELASGSLEDAILTRIVAKDFVA